jgi:2-dehydro-3-deoxyphosphogluconate aldolase / (4S)-4-hydroxy-2-oxoglutarate aldolase
MSAETTYQSIRDAKVVGIIRAPGPEHAIEVGRALLRGGLSVIEVSFNTPNALDAIEALVKDGVGTIGAGTVMNPEDVKRVSETGASFLVAPNLNPSVVTAALEQNLVVGPGVFTPTEAASALALGAQFLKLFPASSAGLGMMKAISEPLPEAAWLAAGGIAFDQIPTWLDAGAVAIGLGSSLTGGSIEDVEKQAAQVASIVARHS